MRVWLVGPLLVVVAGVLVWSGPVGTTADDNTPPFKAKKAQVIPPAEEEDDSRHTPDGEMSSAEKHLLRFHIRDRNFIRYFTTYALPRRRITRDGREVDLRRQAELALPYIINSVASVNSEGFLVNPKRVPGSGTLWWVDIRDLGWKTEDIDAVFALQAYFLSPLVNSTNNVILYRADWFIVNAADVTWQADRGEKVFPHYILLYGLGKEPKNAAEFRAFWQVDLKSIQAQRVETGTIINAGKSGVSRHTRQLSRGRTIFGYYWATKDVLSHDIDRDKILSRDYIEDLFANAVDAGEYIASHKNGLQVYFLSAGVKDNFKRVEFGDPTAVQDRQDGNDIRVRTAKSCMVCHAHGIIPYTNTVRELYQLNGDLRAKNDEIKRILRAFYLKEDGSEVEDDNRLFTRAVNKCNGLDTTDNLKAFLDVYEWYVGMVDVEQAAYECGLGVEEFRKFIAPATSGRLVFLYHREAMPRDVWDSVNVGGYIQAMSLVKAVNNPARPQQIAEPAPAQVVKKVFSHVRVRVESAAVVNSEGKPLVYLGRGIELPVLVEDEGWYKVRHPKYGDGWLRKSEVTPCEPS